MFTFLLVVHAIVAAALVAVILMQRSEGGGLGVGGSPSGLMSARGAADFLTRATTVLASIFVLMSIGLAALATVQRGSREIDTSLARTAAPAAPASDVPMEGDPLAATADRATPAQAPVAPAATPLAGQPPVEAPRARTAPAQTAPVAPARTQAKAAPAPAKEPAKTPVIVLPPPPVSVPAPAQPANQGSVPLAQ